MRQMDRRMRPDHPSRSLWWWFNSFNWNDELNAMSCARLLYWGSEDRQMAKRLRRARDQLLLQEVDFVEFAGLDHAACNSREALERTVVPTVVDWVSSRLGPTW
jgi:hypothetical protein